EEYLEYLYIVYKILNKAYIYISATKSFIGYLAIRLLRYIINGKGIAKTDDYFTTFKKLKFLDTLNSLVLRFSYIRQPNKAYGTN
ncbi:hypothetical protein MYCTH_2069804, partial [Thermothelomyces thermophilus ATCC 42464]